MVMRWWSNSEKAIDGRLYRLYPSSYPVSIGYWVDILTDGAEL